MMLKSMYNFLHTRPQVGLIAAVVTKGSFSLQSILTDELLLKEAAGIGVFMGAAVATVSFITGAIRLAGIIINRLNPKKDEA